MGFLILCAIYIAICEGVCNVLDLNDFSKKSWVYAIVGVFGSFFLKAAMAG